MSALAVTAAGAHSGRSLANLLADAVAVEDFGAAGDGVTDDTAAFTAAVGSGRPVRLAAKTYIVNGQWTVAATNVVLLGVPGQSVMRRLQQVGNGAWICVQASAFRADGVIFDANKAAVTQDSWSELVNPQCTTTEFHQCVFTNAAGSTLGSGLVIQASDPALCEHVVRDCEFSGNTVHGIWVQAIQGALIADCRAHDNGQYGICVDYNDATFRQKVHLVQVLGNRCWNNVRGIAVGNFNTTNLQPPTWGNANPDAVTVLVSGNMCHDNAVYGIAVSGRTLAVQSNLLSNNGTVANSGAGILANVSWSRVSANMITGTALYGIDSGGSLNSDIAGNYVCGTVLGLNCGGGSNIRVADNYLQDCSSWAISVNNVETDGQGSNFGIACSNLAITGNWIALTSPTAGGVVLRDGPQNILVARNDFVGTGNVANCLWANTDTIIIEGNRFNFTARFIVNPYASGSLQQVVFPDIADALMITYAPSGVQSMLTSYQAQSYGQVTFIKATAPGSGYSQATVAIAGAGTGAVAQAYISNGAILGVVVTAAGSGYGPIGTTIPVTITGDGTGAQATGFAGVPIPEERKLATRCNCAVTFGRVGSSPLQENWTLFDLSVPANGDVLWTGTWGSWRASWFPQSAIGSDGGGGTIVQSAANGDVILRPNGTGHVRLTSAAQQTGCTSSVGTGAPEGVVTAPPGSDYRNLSGGSGTTFYVKRSGSGNTGWFAVA